MQRKRSVQLPQGRMDETYIEIKGVWHDEDCAVDQRGETVDFYLSRKRDGEAAEAFFEKAISRNGVPEKVVIDKSGANRKALENINNLFYNSVVLMFYMIQMIDIKYLNHIVEQSHRPIKAKMRQALGWLFSILNFFGCSSDDVRARSLVNN